MAWTEQVADNGKFSSDPTSDSGGLFTDRWIGVAAGIVTVILMAGAISAITMQFFRDPAPVPVAVAQADQPKASVAPPLTRPTSPAPTATPTWPVAVVGAFCLPNSNNGVTADGSVAYCVNLQDTKTSMWSLYPGDIPSPSGDLSQQEDPSLVLCMKQTTQTRAQCVQYLQRPSDPGDGRPEVG